MAIKQIDHGTPEYEKMVMLRDEILRRPLGLTFSPEDLEKEKQDILVAAFDDDIILACCLLTEVDNETVRLRQMAVKQNQQGKGIGQTMIVFAETIARDKGYKKLMMHARDTAVGFYEKQGYRVNGERFYEVTIPHLEMEKRLV
jgi:predicted GNAT family N-acyltransferase